MAALKYWIWLSDAAVSARAKAEIMRRYGDAEQAFFAPTGAFAAMESIRREDAETLERRDLDRAERVIEACARQGLEIITFDDRAYPARLKKYIRTAAGAVCARDAAARGRQCCHCRCRHAAGDGLRREDGTRHRRGNRPLRRHRRLGLDRRYRRGWGNRCSWRGRDVHRRARHGA